MNKDKVLVGQVRNTNEGGSFTVIEFHSATNVIIRHNDEHDILQRFPQTK